MNVSFEEVQTPDGLRLHITMPVIGAADEATLVLMNAARAEAGLNEWGQEDVVLHHVNEQVAAQGRQPYAKADTIFSPAQDLDA